MRDALHFLDLPLYMVLHEPRKKLEYAFFLNSGMASSVFNTNGGESVEVGVTGNEGFTPIPAAAGIRHSPHEVMMQLSGNGFRMPVAALLYRYAAVHGFETAQTAGPGISPVCQSLQWMISGDQSSRRIASRAARQKRMKRSPSSV